MPLQVCFAQSACSFTFSPDPNTKKNTNYPDEVMHFVCSRVFRVAAMVFAGTVPPTTGQFAYAQGYKSESAFDSYAVGATTQFQFMFHRRGFH